MIWLLLALLVQAPSDVVLSGAVGPAEKGTYQEHVFDVPAGTTRIDFTFTHSHKDVGAQLEVGVFDPSRFRGTSRFSKTDFYIAEGHATPSYHAGPLPEGRWRISLGIPAIGTSTRVEWKVTIAMSSSPATRSPLAAPAAAPRWLVGDFHAHTMHSDGFGCVNPETPAATRGCHTWEIVEAARARALDFVAITDHNTTSHHTEMAALQQTIPNLLLVRGQELTTFHGHANVYGTSAFIDFRLGFGGRTITRVVDDIVAAGGLLSINHPGRETGDRCTGCGWDAPGTPWSRIEVMELVNGTNVEGPTAGLGFWQARLNEGHRIVAIGGSDDHAVRSTRTRLATPTTVVFAAGLSETALLDGVRTGRVYIRTRGPEGPTVDIALTGLGDAVAMGGTLRLNEPGDATLRIETTGAAGQQVEVVKNGEIVATPTVPAEASTLTVAVRVAPGDWVNVRLRDDRGITTITNPVYIRQR
jgi:hypothetical protein